MSDPATIIQEAQKRGLLSQEQVDVYEAAASRGLINGGGATAPKQEPAAPSSPEDYASAAAADPYLGGLQAPWFRQAGAYANNTVNSLTAGLGDRINAGLSNLGVGGGAYNPHGGSQLEAERKHRAQQREEFPLASIAGDITGFLPAGTALASGLTKILPSITNTYRGAVAATAADGALYGTTVNTSNFEAEQGRDATIGERSMLGARDAAFGGAAGGAFKGGADVLRPAIRSGTGLVAQLQDGLAKAFGRTGGAVDQHAETVARNAIMRSIDRSGMSLQDIQNAIQEFGDKPAVLAEVIGQDAVNALTALTRRPGTTSQQAQGIIADRYGGFVDRARSDLEDVTGIDPDNVTAMREGLQESARAEAGPIYDMAFRDAADIDSPRLQQLAEAPDIRKHLERADREIATRAAIADRPVSQMSNLDRWDVVKRSLDDDIAKAVANDQKQALRVLTSLKNEVVQELDRLASVRLANGDDLSTYAAARQAGEIAPQLEAAETAGRRAVRSSSVKPRDVASAVEGLGEGAPRDMFSAGMISELADKFDNNFLPQRFRVPAVADKVRAGLGEEAGNEIVSRMEAEATLRDLGSRWGPNMNSVTGTVLEGSDNGIVDGAVEAGFNFATGNKVGLGRQLINFLRPRGFSEAQRDAMGDILLSNPQEGLARLGLPLGNSLDPDGSLQALAQSQGISRNALAEMIADNGVDATRNRLSTAGTSQLPPLPPSSEAGFIATGALPPILGASGGFTFAPDLDGDGEVSFGDRIVGGTAGLSASIIGRRLVPPRRSAGAAATDIVELPDETGFGVFGGRRSRAANTDQLAGARASARSGQTDEMVFDETGWFRGADKKWRYEIDGAGGAIKDSSFWKDGGTRNLEEVLDHPNLFEAYPYLRKKKVTVKDMRGASFDPVLGNINIGKAHPQDQVGMLLHEIQHSIQKKEGFAKGTAPLFSHNRYLRAMGETEARNVQQRAITPSLRDRKPWLSEDEARANQLYGGLRDGIPAVTGQLGGAVGGFVYAPDFTSGDDGSPDGYVSLGERLVGAGAGFAAGKYGGRALRRRPYNPSSRKTQSLGIRDQQAGFIATGALPPVLGASGGAVAGNTLAPEDATLEERLGYIAAGAGTGLAVGTGTSVAAGRSGGWKQGNASEHFLTDMIEKPLPNGETVRVTLSPSGEVAFDFTRALSEAEQRAMPLSEVREVFGTALDGVMRLLRKHKPENVRWLASGRSKNGGRGRLYTKFLGEQLSSMGYTQRGDGSWYNPMPTMKEKALVKLDIAFERLDELWDLITDHPELSGALAGGPLGLAAAAVTDNEVDRRRQNALAEAAQ